jgi:hypothetical protein
MRCPGAGIVILDGQVRLISGRKPRCGFISGDRVVRVPLLRASVEYTE